MARFVLRNTTGGSALRDGHVLQEPTGNLYVDTLVDTLALTQTATDRLAHPEVIADTVTFATTAGGGTAYIVSGSSTVVFTTTSADTFGGAGNDYNHAWADTLVLATTLVELFNLTVVPLLPVAVEPWGRSQRWNAWVEFLVAGQVVASSAVNDFTLLGGRVTEDLTRAICGDVTLELGFPAGSPFIPTELGDLLDPHGETVIRVWAGYLGQEVPMGLFDLATTPLNLTPGGLAVSVTGMSFERVLQRAGFWTVENWDVELGPWPYNGPDEPPQGYSAFHMIAKLVRDVLGPDTPVAWLDSDARVVTASFKPGDDRLSKLAEIAQSASIEFRFNRIGHFVMTNAPTAADFGRAQAQWEFLDGRNATLLNAVREFSDAESYNGVVVEGSGGDDVVEPVYAVLWISDPSSPLYFNPALGVSASRWGPRAKHVRSIFASTQAGAESIARAELAKLSVASDSMVVQAPANAALEPFHYARLRAADLSVDETYRIVRVVHDLSGGPVEVTLHRDKVV